MKQTAMLAAAALRLALPASPGGAEYARVLSQAVLKPYTAATGQRVEIQALTPGGGWDLAQLPRDALDRACQAGRVHKIDWQRVGGRDRFLPAATSDCGVGAYLRSTVLTWDTVHVPGAPGWADFWNVVRMPGKRGLHRSAMGNLEIALLADGVAPAEIYRVLRAPGGVDRAFHKLDQLKPYVVWWSADSDAMAIVASGEVLMSSAPSDRVRAADRRLHRSFGIQWTGSLLTVQSWAIAATARAPHAAEALIAAATDPAREQVVADAVGLAPAIVPANKAAAAASLGLPLDAGFWRDNGAALEQRFSTWLKH